MLEALTCSRASDTSSLVRKREWEGVGVRKCPGREAGVLGRDAGMSMVAKRSGVDSIIGGRGLDMTRI
jgi:hypothetical protein